jgi:hypothetical protein
VTATTLLSRLDEHTDRLGDLLTVLTGQAPRALPPGYGELLDELVDSLDDLRDAIARAAHDAALGAARDAALPPPGEPSSSPSTDVPPSAGARLHYGSLVARIVARVPALVPADSVVAVVTRGDAALLGFVGVEGRHYPQDASGTWAGFHPADDAHAIALLAEVQRRGADHLLVPAPSAWWFNHYAGWRRHLDDTARLVARDDDLTLYELGRETAAAAPPDAAPRQYDRQVRLFLELADALLPSGSLVAVVTRGDEAFLATRAVQARPFPADDHGIYAGHPADDDDALAALRRAQAGGATHLAIPAPLRWWDDAYPGFVAALRRRHRLLADRRQAGVFFELDPPPPATDSE